MTGFSCRNSERCGQEGGRAAWISIREALGRGPRASRTQPGLARATRQEVSGCWRIALPA